MARLVLILAFITAGLVSCNDHWKKSTNFTLALTTTLEAMPRVGWISSYDSPGATPFPGQQPFSEAPLAYQGQERMEFELTDQFIDWIYVELRSTRLPNSLVAARAGFLKANGQVVDVDGASPLAFSDAPNGQYYVVVYVKGHLPLISEEKSIL